MKNKLIIKVNLKKILLVIGIISHMLPMGLKKNNKAHHFSITITHYKCIILRFYTIHSDSLPNSVYIFLLLTICDLKYSTIVPPMLPSQSSPTSEIANLIAEIFWRKRDDSRHSFSPLYFCDVIRNLRCSYLLRFTLNLITT